MAEPDHTVPARPPGPPTHPFSPTTDAPSGARGFDENMRLELRSALASMEALRGVITCLRADSLAFREAMDSGSWTQPLAWLPEDSIDASLLVAVHYLDEGAGMLRHALYR
jgi:hypothetical protein